MISICNANVFMQYKYAMHAMHVLVLLISMNECGGAFRAEQKKRQTASIRAYQIDGTYYYRSWCKRLSEKLFESEKW